VLEQVRCQPLERRLAIAERIRTLSDVTLPDLEWFNSDPCDRHATLDDGMRQNPPCQRCGIRFRRHQRVGVAWLFVRGHGLIADKMGLGKTAQAAGLIAMMKQAGELNRGRVIVVCRPAALDQWYQQMIRFLPRLVITTATGSRKHRVNKYLSGWEVLITGHQMFIKDLDLLDNFPTAAIVVDDVDPLRTRTSQTAYAVKRAARNADRTVVLTGTSLQKRLHELHSVLEPVGGLSVLGSETSFRRRFVREEHVKVYNRSAGRLVSTRKVVGYKNLDEFKAVVAPLVLRRTPDDLDSDADMPAIAPPNNVYLDLYPAQRDRYEELRRGVLKILKAEGASVKQAKAVAQWIYGAQICAGLVTLGEPDRPGTSVKLDWVQNTLVDGDLSDEKVVVFCQFTNTVKALMDRLANHGVDHVVIWGREPNAKTRAAAIAKFWNDPNCRVLVGTSAIEQSLNLQNARHLINVDQIMNAARMAQLAGRICRLGSAHRTVYVHNLLAADSQEDSYLDLLAREQGLSDFIWDEASTLYEALSPMALLELVGGRR
jgi:SNF2 family DNA or RNA helicase